MDNRYQNYNCPLLMSDGRFISSYIRSSTYDQYIRNINNIDSAHEYKHYLQNNTDDILNKIRESLMKNNVCHVDGRCLPMNNNKINSSDPKTGEWIEEEINYSIIDSNLISNNNVLLSQNK